MTLTVAKVPGKEPFFPFTALPSELQQMIIRITLVELAQVPTEETTKKVARTYTALCLTSRNVRFQALEATKIFKCITTSPLFLPLLNRTIIGGVRYIDASPAMQVGYSAILAKQLRGIVPVSREEPPVILSQQTVGMHLAISPNTPLTELRKLTHILPLRCLSEAEGRRILSLLGEMHSLRFLDCSNCRWLTEIPPSIAGAQNLRVLDCSNCPSLVTLPPEIGALKKLKRLLLGSCRYFRYFPVEVCDLNALEEIRITGSDSFCAFPRNLGKLGNLKILVVANCPYLETLPASLIYLEHLHRLHIISCGITHLPDELGRLHELESLDLRYLPLRSLPRSIAYLDHLTKCDIRRTQIDSLPSTENEQWPRLSSLTLQVYPPIAIHPALRRSLESHQCAITVSE